MARVYLGLGSNISPEDNLKLGLDALAERYGSLVISSVYRNAAVGFDGDDFLNLVVAMATDASPLAICEEIELIHNLAGRVRNSEKWGPRPLDIDLLLYNDRIIDERPVRVPRDDILKYDFVLRPLAEIAPELKHPVTGQTMLELWQNFDATSHTLEKVRVDW